MPSEGGLTPRYILAVLARWWWLILSVPVGAWLYLHLTTSGAGAIPTYTAESRILVQQVSPSGLINYDDLYSSQQLARLYAVLMKEEEIIGRVVSEMGLEQSPQAVAGWVTATAVPGQPLLDIGVTHPNPRVAADVANKVVEVFIDQTRQYRLGEVARLQSMAEAFGVQDRGQFLAQQVAAMGSFVVVKRASPPGTPDGDAGAGGRELSLVILATGLVGLVAFLLEALLDRVRTPERLEALGGRKVLGVVPGWRSRKVGQYVPVLAQRPSSRYAEAYRQMALSILNSQAGRERQGLALLVSSAAPSEGKTTTAVNLAIALAESGRKVLLVDGDLWRPTIHRWFGLANDAGLTDLLIAEDPEPGAVIRPTPVKNLQVVTSGKRPSPHGPILEKDNVEQTLARLRQEAEILVVDSPPVLGHSFASLLACASHTVIVVADADATQARALRAALEVMAGARGQGEAPFELVLNRFRPSRAEYYAYYWPYGGYYGQYGSYYVTGGDAAALAAPRRRRAWRRRRDSD